MTNRLPVAGTNVRVGINGGYGIVIGPSHESNQHVVVEYYPGPGSGHHHADELTVVDELPKGNWNHFLR